MDTLGQPLTSQRGTDSGRRRFALGTALVALLVLPILPRPPIDPPVHIPPDLVPPGTTSVADLPPRFLTPGGAHTVTAPSPTPTTMPRARPLAIAKPTVTTVPGCPTVTVVPRAIRIPAIGVSSRSVVPLGLNPDRSLAVPSLNKVGQLGWYSCSPAPGDTGPSIVVAHVDQQGKPGLFVHLSELAVGSVVEIDRSDGQTAIFRVTGHKQFLKRQFDTSIYDDTPDSELRMITCSGDLDVTHHNFLSQEVAFARLISLRPTDVADNPTSGRTSTAAGL